jgi:hypothetical protein
MGEGQQRSNRAGRDAAAASVPTPAHAEPAPRAEGHR